MRRGRDARTGSAVDWRSSTSIYFRPYSSPGRANAKPMKLCRYDNNRLGIVEGDEVLDVSKALAVIPRPDWPIAQGDPLIANFKRVIAAAKKLAPRAKNKPLSKVRLPSPVLNPGKIIGGPYNYDDDIAASFTDTG